MPVLEELSAPPEEDPLEVASALPLEDVLVGEPEELELVEVSAPVVLELDSVDIGGSPGEDPPHAASHNTQTHSCFTRGRVAGDGSR